VAAILLLVGLKRWRRTFPGALVVVALFTALAGVLGLESAGLRIVGDVPGGLPLPTLPALDPGAVWALLPVALTIALVGFMESIAVAKVYAAKNKHDVDPNQELVALGAANLVGAFFRAFPTTGGFSRTAVNDQAGARTTLASLVSAGIIALTLLFLTGLFRTLPNAVLAAIVMVAGGEPGELAGGRAPLAGGSPGLRHDDGDLRRHPGAGIEEGILVGVLASLGALVYETSRSPTRRSWDASRDGHLPEPLPAPGGRPSGGDHDLPAGRDPLLRQRGVPEGPGAGPGGGEETPRALVFDFHAVNGVDSTALHHLEELLGYLRGLGVEVFFAGVKGPVMDRFRRAPPSGSASGRTASSTR
jgi:sulfate permease, SulP family